MRRDFATHLIRGGAEAGECPRREESINLWPGKGVGPLGALAAHLGPAQPLRWAPSPQLARSSPTNAVVQLGSSHRPQPERLRLPPAARGDRFALHKTGRLGPGCGEAATPAAAWESQRIAPESPEGARGWRVRLSPVLNSDESMPQSQLSQAQRCG